MATIPANLARVASSTLQTSMLSNLRQNNLELFKAQQELATGRRVNRPSDDSSVVSTVNLLQRVQARAEQQQTNFSRAQTTLDSADGSLGTAFDMLLEAQNIASSQVGIGSNAQTRANQAQVIDSMLDEMVNLANREVRGVHLFAGRNADAKPFEEQFGGVRYVGDRENLTADLGLVSELGVNSNGAEAFNALSSRVQSQVDLDPNATDATRIDDVAGANDRGVKLGAIQLDVDGTAVNVDLAGANTLGDIATRINAAIDDIDNTAGALSVSGDGFQLTANAGHQITLNDIEDAAVAADLGIDALDADASASGSPVNANGADLDPRITERTAVSAFAGGLDLTSGLKITNGTRTEIVDFTGVTNVRDMINRVQAADIGVRMEINAEQTGFNLVNEVSGVNLSVGENSGGSTATDLGLRTFDTTTALADLNFGDGVSTVSGADLAVQTHDGTTFEVDLSAATTVNDVITQIESDAAAAGLTVPGDFDVALAADGNGLVVTDNTAGGSDLVISAVNGSNAAKDLGIAGNAGGAATLAGEDVAQVRTESIFSHLMMLRDGLRNNDSAAITSAGTKLDADTDHLTAARADLGVRAQRVQQAATRLEDRQVADSTLLSELVDADFNETITRFTQLQQQLQANLLSGQQLLNLNVLNFLR